MAEDDVGSEGKKQEGHPLYSNKNRTVIKVIPPTFKCPIPHPPGYFTSISWIETSMDGFVCSQRVKDEGIVERSHVIIHL